MNGLGPNEAVKLPPNTSISRFDDQVVKPRSGSGIPAQIPSGLWQRIVATVFLLFGIFASLAATPFNSAGAIGGLCLAAAASFFFWGILLRYLAIIEAKLDRIRTGLAE